MINFLAGVVAGLLGVIGVASLFWIWYFNHSSTPKLSRHAVFIPPSRVSNSAEFYEPVSDAERFEKAKDLNDLLK